MSIEWLLLMFILTGMFITLIKEWMAPDITIFISLALITLFGFISPEEAIAGFSNTAVLTVALLFIIGTAVQKSGVLHRIIDTALGKSQRLSLIIVKIMTPVSFLSAFMNNTPIVAMLTPIIRNRAAKYNISPSKLLIPLSYASILGGTVTLIGTSTILLVHGLLEQRGIAGFSMFEFMYVGIPLTIIGICYMVFYGQYRLPNRKVMIDSFQETNKEYMVEFIVQKHSKCIGQTVQEAKLKKLQNLFLVEMIRGDQTIIPSPTEVIQLYDRLIFSGNVSKIMQLANTNNFKLGTGNHSFLSRYKKGNANLIEAVISHSSPLINKKIKDIRFRSMYQAAIVAIRRKSEDIVSEIGNVILKPGDTLLLLTGKDFLKSWSDSQDFYLISDITPEVSTRSKKAKTIMGTLAGVVLLTALQIVSILKAAMLGVLVLLLTRSITPQEARKSIDLSVVILMASAIGIGQAVENTGLATYLANFILNWQGVLGLIGIAFLIYLITVIFTEIMNNLAAAALLFPVAMSVAIEAGYNPKLFAVIIAIAASCSFITPIGYQTNLLVFGPGGYKFTDFIKVGTPLTILCMMITICVSILVWG